MAQTPDAYEADDDGVALGSGACPPEVDDGKKLLTVRAPRSR